MATVLRAPVLTLPHWRQDSKPSPRTRPLQCWSPERQWLRLEVGFVSWTLGGSEPERLQKQQQVPVRLWAGAARQHCGCPARSAEPWAVCGLGGGLCVIAVITPRGGWWLVAGSRAKHSGGVAHPCPPGHRCGRRGPSPGLSPQPMPLPHHGWVWCAQHCGPWASASLSVP